MIRYLARLLRRFADRLDEPGPESVVPVQQVTYVYTVSSGCTCGQGCPVHGFGGWTVTNEIAPVVDHGSFTVSAN